MDKVVNFDFLDKFSGKKVFITGHTGFKGSWLALALHEIGADVMGYALPPEYPDSHFELLGLDQSIQNIEGDIREASKLMAVLDSFQPEFVFHLAAQALVRRSYLDPKETFNTNVMGSVNLLEAVRNCKSVRSLVYITSDKCYENKEWIWGYRENDRLGGVDPYSASKASAEMVFSAYDKSYFSHNIALGVATARAGNVIGGGDWANDRIVPDCIRSIRDKASIKLRSPGATRPWQHVLEPISGYLMLAANLRISPKKFSGSWNFGPQTTEVRTVQEVAERIVAILGSGVIEAEKSESGHEANLLQLNCDKAIQQLGWHSRWNVEKTLLVTADWYKQVLNGKEVRLVSRTQLYDYFSELN